MGDRRLIQFPVGDAKRDRAYWLCRCEGFLVCRGDGERLGRVAELHYLSRLDQPDELTVPVGLFGLRRRTYPVEAVQEILAHEQRLILAPDAVAT